MLQSCFGALEQCKVQLDYIIQLHLPGSQRGWGCYLDNEMFRDLEFFEFTDESTC